MYKIQLINCIVKVPAGVVKFIASIAFYIHIQQPPPIPVDADKGTRAEVEGSVIGIG
jgi:hypothetical protein